MEVCEYRTNKGDFCDFAFEIEKYFSSPLENTSVDITNKGDFDAFKRLCFI